MWHNLVSSLESTVQLVMFGLILMGSQHPWAMGGIVLFFVVMIAMLVAESVEDRRAAPRSAAAAPIRVKR